MSRSGDRLRTGLRAAGQTMITMGVVVLLFCVYELYVTNLFAARDQQRLARHLSGLWAAPAPVGGAPTLAVAPGAAPPTTAGPAQPSPPAQPDLPVFDGSPFARLYLPRLHGLHPLVIVEGVDTADLKEGGPGHLPGTALPGAVGNVVLSGHRTTYGAPFGDLDEVAAGDPVILETRTSWFTYRVTGTRIVAPTATEVTLPVPDHAGTTPTQALLTLTTCHPRYSARQRLIVFATLEAALDKTGGVRPDALRQT